MKNKKGFEVSITVIVLLILSILIFILAVGLVVKWFGKAENLKAELDRQTEQQILSALRQSNSLVAIPLNIHEVERSETSIFGIGIRNVGSPKAFSGLIRFSGAYNPDGSIISTADPDYIEAHWLGNFRNITTFHLSKNQQKVIPVAVKVDTHMAENQITLKGDYVFNVCIFDSPSPGICSLNNLGAVFTNRIYQFTVRVV